MSRRLCALVLVCSLAGCAVLDIAVVGRPSRHPASEEVLCPGGPAVGDLIGAALLALLAGVVYNLRCGFDDGTYCSAPTPTATYGLLVASGVFVTSSVLGFVHDGYCSDHNQVKRDLDARASDPFAGNQGHVCRSGSTILTCNAGLTCFRGQCQPAK